MRFRIGVPRSQTLALPVLVDALDLSAVEATFHDQGPGAPATEPRARAASL